MNIKAPDIIFDFSDDNLLLEEGLEWFEVHIRKTNHDFKVQVLKNGQYIFVSVLDKGEEFPIEHIEFYMDETKDEVLEEFKGVVKGLKENPSRTSEVKSWFRKTKLKVELQIYGKWKTYGYPGEKIKKTVHNKTYKQ